VALPQTRVFEAAVQFARTEGIISAPESAHAILAAIDEARAADRAGERRAILFNLSGHGHFDLAAYDQYLSGRLVDYAYPEESVREAMKSVPAISS
jgi:tryptophan synthase beta chain